MCVEEILKTILNELNKLVTWQQQYIDKSDMK